MNFVLRYKFEGGSEERIQEQIIQLSQESMLQPISLKLRPVDDYTYYDRGNRYVNITFNKKEHCNIIKSIDDIESITISQKYYDSEEFDVEFNTQIYWSRELDRLTGDIGMYQNKRDDKLKEIYQIDNDLINYYLFDELKEYNRKIEECQKQIDSIENSQCEIEYKRKQVTKYIILPPDITLKMDLSCGYSSVFFFWPKNTLEELATNATKTDEEIEIIKKMIPKVHSTKRKYNF